MSRMRDAGCVLMETAIILVLVAMELAAAVAVLAHLRKQYSWHRR